MSVPTWKRRESKVLYLDTARQLCEFTLKFMKKFPKSATFYIAQPIMQSALNVYKYCSTANARFIKNESDIAFRKDQLTLALGELDSMDCNISIAINAYSISTKENQYCEIESSEYSWTHWGELIYSERSLIIKLLESDANRKLSKS